MHTRITHTLGAVAAAGALTTLGLAGTSMPSAAASTTPAARPAHPVTAYVANFSSGTVTPISTAINKAGKAITVGQWPVAIAITPNGKTAYVAGTGSGPTGCIQAACSGQAPAAGSGTATVTPIITSTNKPGRPIKIAGGAGDIAITPNGTTAYIVSSPYVIPVRTAANTALKAVTVGPEPIVIAITPDGKTAYVALDNSTSRGDFPGQVIPISTVTNKAGKGITVGIGPAAIAITP
jgi:hyaluronoglucosaminidase